MIDCLERKAYNWFLEFMNSKKSAALSVVMTYMRSIL